MDCFEVNAVNYGAPQLRERALFIGNRYNMQVDFPMPTHGQTMSEDMFDKAQLALWRTLGDAIGDMDDPGDGGSVFSRRKKHFLAQLPSGSNWRPILQEPTKQPWVKPWATKRRH